MTNRIDQLADSGRRAFAWTRQRAWPVWATVRRSERGEGVISAAIAVLVMAFLGAAMWFAFSGTMNTAQSKVDNNVTQIGGNSSTGAATAGGVGGTAGASNSASPGG